MKGSLSVIVLLFAGWLTAPVHAAEVTGRLELRWGDPVRAQAGAGERFTATLVADDGTRYALDPAQARRAAGDLYALANRRVAVEFAVAKGAKLYRTEVIAPMEGAVGGEPAKAVLGTTVWATVMCKFSDIATEQKPLSFFQSQYANTAGLLDHYWREVSYDKVNLTGSTAYGWVTLPHPRSHYVTTVNGTEDADLDALFDDCTTAADAQVNFGANGGLQGINMMFNGDLDGYAWGGGRCAVLDGVNKCWSTTWNPPWAFNNLAPLAHEMGHGYGLPHANNSDGDSDPYDNPWDVMSDAWNNATSSSTYGTLAKHINAYHRERLGWIDAARKLTIQAGNTVPQIALDRASLRGSTNPQVIVVTIPGGPATRYYTIEARRRVGNYDGNLAGDAVIIHQVDTNRSTPAWSMDATVPPANRANNEGSMFKPGESWAAPGNAFRVRVHAATAEGFLVSVCGAPVRGRYLDACTSLSATATGRRDHAPLPAVPPGAPPRRTH